MLGKHITTWQPFSSIKKKYILALEYIKKAELQGFKVHPEFKKKVLNLLKQE